MNEIIRRLQAVRCSGSIKLCTDTLRADSRLELHVHFCIQAGYHAGNPPWNLSPGCTRVQFKRTQTSTISHRREHAHAPARQRERTHAHGHINAPRTRSCTRAHACASTRMRTREETGTTYQTVCGDSMCLPGRARQLSVPGLIESYLVDSN
jgi:hypothetical protein